MEHYTRKQSNPTIENTKLIRDEIVFYVEQNIIPQYSKFDSAHKEDHAKIVIKRSLDLYHNIKAEINPELLYIATASHNQGISANRETHHIKSEKNPKHTSSERLVYLRGIEIIAQATEDHRASNKSTQKSIYGKIVAEGDRLINCNTIIERTLLYRLERYHEISHIEHIQRVLDHLEEYGRSSYLHLCIDWSDNAEQLENPASSWMTPKKTNS